MERYKRRSKQREGELDFWEGEAKTKRERQRGRTGIFRGIEGEHYHWFGASLGRIERITH